LSGNRDCLFNKPFYRTIDQPTHQLTKKQRANQESEQADNQPIHATVNQKAN